MIGIRYPDAVMSKIGYRTTPTDTAGMPPGIPYIIGNEAAERFTFYGLKGVLVIYMTKHLLTAAGTPDNMTEPQAREWFHAFVASVYFFPLIGALISDGLWGKYTTIIRLSCVYTLGCITLCGGQTREWL